jgi:predicted AAA+ superfamily ATPase
MSLKPWREIARPHKDVLEGSLKQSEFAADITQVATGVATPEYQDAEKFFARTYITEGMSLLLTSVAQRLAGQGGDPVVQLQTAFGGGKTHTMLAVYHLASRKVPTSQLAGIPPLLDKAGIQDLPQARIAVIDGIALAPSQESVKKTGQKVATLWHEIAWQLLGDEGLAMIKASDEEGTSPGKTLLVELLTKAAPCVVLVDELVAFLRQFEPGKSYRAGTFDSNLTFIQALTEAMKSVPNAMLLASLPESELEVGGTMGQLALNSLEKYFARVESVWKPVGAEEAFEIVRRRLFDTAGERNEVEQICRAFADFYRQYPTLFPTEVQESHYYERLCASYPIHPEVFDRLYDDWSTLEKFQRTRGVLQYMATVIHRLWNSDNRDAMIMPGSLPLDDAAVLNKSVHYLPHRWEPVIEREIDGPRSIPFDIDGHSLFGSVQAARRAARTIFLGSAPSTSNQTLRGIKQERIMLGTVQPGQSVGVFEDVLKHLRDRLHYLYAEQDRYWLDTKPNLRREMETRKQNINERDELQPLLKTRVNHVFGKEHKFSGIHVFTPSADVPDDYGIGPRLVVLPTNAGYSKTERNQAVSAAEEILLKRGEQPRQKQNRLIFLAPEFDVVSRLKEQGCIYLAWQSIVSDIDSGVINQDLSQLKQAKDRLAAANSSFNQLIRETWKWLLVPDEVQDTKTGRMNRSWNAIKVSTTSVNLIKSIEETLREEEYLADELAPIHLKSVLEKWYFKDGDTEVSALKVWQDSCHYLYLPRMTNDQVFRNTIVEGVKTQDFFGFASGKEGDRYLGFSFGNSTLASLDEHSLLIERDTAAAYAAKLEQAKQAAAAAQASANAGASSGASQTDGLGVADTDGAGSAPVAPTGALGGGVSPRTVSDVSAIKNRFYGTLELDAVKAKMDFATIMDEVVQQFTAQLGVDVTITVEIEAHKADGFDESLQRTIKENCNVLKFSAAEFDQD